MKFYINKYPIIICFKQIEEENQTVPEGTAFTVCGITQQSYVLKPVKKIELKTGDMTPIYDFTPEILASAFNKVDYLPK